MRPTTHGSSDERPSETRTPPLMPANTISGNGSTLPQSISLTSQRRKDAEVKVLVSRSTGMTHMEQITNKQTKEAFVTVTEQNHSDKTQNSNSQHQRLCTFEINWLIGLNSNFIFFSHFHYTVYDVDPVLDGHLGLISSTFRISHQRRSTSQMWATSFDKLPRNPAFFDYTDVYFVIIWQNYFIHSSCLQWGGTKAEHACEREWMLNNLHTMRDGGVQTYGPRSMGGPLEASIGPPGWMCSSFRFRFRITTHMEIND